MGRVRGDRESETKSTTTGLVRLLRSPSRRLTTQQGSTTLVRATTASNSTQRTSHDHPTSDSRWLMVHLIPSVPSLPPLPTPVLIS